MKVIDPGHRYLLNHLDDDGRGSEPTALVFVKREGPGYPGNEGHHAGTNLQEVLRALISRVKYLEGQESHPNNAVVIMNLRHAIWLLESRAAERHGRVFDLSAKGVVDINDSSIEDAPTCQQCGHVGCLEACRGRVELTPSVFPDHDRDGRGHRR